MGSGSTPAQENIQKKPYASGFLWGWKHPLLLSTRPNAAITCSGRAVLRTGPMAAHDPTPKSSDPPRSSGRIAVVVNGNAKSVTGEVIETLDQILASGDLFVSRRVEESEAIARTLVDRGYGTI